MNTSPTFIFLIGLLELLLGIFILVLSTAIYYFDIFEFKISGKRKILVCTVMLMGWILFIHGALAAFSNYHYCIGLK